MSKERYFQIKFSVVLDDQPVMIMTIFEHGEGEQNEDDVSLICINL